MQKPQCPLRSGTLVWRGWSRLGIGVVDQVGTPVQAGKDWLVPVRFTGGECGVVWVKHRVRFNGIEDFTASELHPRNGECDRVLRTSSHMPEVHLGQGSFRVCVAEDCVDFSIDVTFTNKGPELGGLQLIGL